jgi:hypothetical protein
MGNFEPNKPMVIVSEYHITHIKFIYKTFKHIINLIYNENFR